MIIFLTVIYSSIYCTRVFTLPVAIPSESNTLNGQNITYVQPEQVHLSLGFDAYEIFVTWTTYNFAPSIVEFGFNYLDNYTTGNVTLFIDGGKSKRRMYIHRVHLKGLTPNSKYIYHCGSSKGWSALFFFHTIREGTDWSPKIALYGDMGNINAQSMARLQQETQRGHFDAIMHVGDFAYDLATDNGLVGDQFMRQIETMAAYVPYMTTPGNHEKHYNFSNYKNRFTMPGGDGEGMFYSYDLGKAHFISISSEVFFWPDLGKDQIKTQYNWLLADLKQANQKMNRVMRPWIVVLAHRPMYCTADDKDDCTFINSTFRAQYEKLFYDYGVDVMVMAHEHSYQRFWPTYDYVNCNGSYESPYLNPRGPVHIVTGSAGCDEYHDHWGPMRDWLAFRSNDYGYTRMTIHNGTHLYLDQISDDKNGKIIDKVWLIQENHGAGTFKCHMQKKKLLFKNDDDHLKFKPYIPRPSNSIEDL